MRKAILLLALLCGCVVWPGGCAQSTKQAQWSTADQAVTTPTQQASQTPTTITIRVDPWNGPDAETSGRSMDRRPARSTTQPAADLVGLKTDAQKGQAGATGMSATYNQVVNVWIDTSASGSSGGTATGTGTGTQTASPVATASPTQTVTADVGISLSAIVGGIVRAAVDQAMAQRDSQAPVTSTVDQAGSDTLTQIRGEASKLRDLIAQWMAGQAASRPAP